MRVSLEWFLLDNFSVNWLLLKLAGALGGMRFRPVRAALASGAGALWDLLALSRFPGLLSLPGRIGCLLLTALLVSRREYLRTLLSLTVASILLGGGMLLFSLGRSPGVGGVILGTLPLRAAVLGLCLLPPLGRAVGYLVHRGYEGSCRRRIALTVGGQTFALTALVDSGNLLTEPLSGLPVVLTEGIDLPPGRPLSVAGQGIIQVVPGVIETGPGRAPVAVYVGASPLPLIDFQALLPAAALHEGRKERVQKDPGVFLSTLRPLVHPALSLLSGPHGGEPAPAPVSGGGASLRPAVDHQRGGPESAHRAQPQAGGVHRPEV